MEPKALKLACISPLPETVGFHIPSHIHVQAAYLTYIL